MTITQTITALPAAPSRSDPANFNTRADALLGALPGMVTELNTANGQLNSTADDVAQDAADAQNAADTAAASANFAGRWADLTGAVTVPTSVHHNGRYWQLLEDLADVTAAEPGVSDAWAMVYRRDFYKHNLKVKTNATNPTYQADIDADELVLSANSGHRYLAADVDLTVDITASGAGGLDTGSEAVSTLYYLWVIYNGTTVTGLISTSSSAPTLPSGYIYKRLVGEVYNDASGNFVGFARVNDEVWFEDPQTVYTSTTLSNAMTQKNLPSSVPAGCSLLHLVSSTSQYDYGNYQIFSPDGSNHKKGVDNHSSNSHGGNDDTAGFNKSSFDLRINGANYIYAAIDYNASYAYQNLHVWGYTLER